VTVSQPGTWTESNQRYLVSAIDTVRTALERHAARASGNGTSCPDPDGGVGVDGASDIGDWPFEELPSLREMSRVFDLSPFEETVLVMTAAFELDASIGSLLAQAHRDPQRAYPTLGVGLAALDGAHWSAVSPAGPLRAWRLVELDLVAGRPVTSCVLRIDEWALNQLTGARHLDTRLTGLVQPVQPCDVDLPVAHEPLVAAAMRAWAGSLDGGRPPVLQLVGSNEQAQRAVLSAVCARLGLGLLELERDAIPADRTHLRDLGVLLERECAMARSALFVRAHDDGPAEGVGGLHHLLETFTGEIAVGRRTRAEVGDRPTLSLDVVKPSFDEQLETWMGGRGSLCVDHAALDRMTAEFDLHLPEIRAVLWEAGQVSGDDDSGAAAWGLARARNRPRLAHLAKVVVPAAEWSDLVLPDLQRRQLGDMVAQASHRTTVYRRWGFAGAGTRGLGITALFAGPSGTGKTLAAEVIANELDLDLCCIDLSAVVSKYIGETEKNLRQVFDAVESGGTLLFFDEADALFGKRSEVKDSHDRYANIEVGYLLQRMEAFRGVAVLATNKRGSLDAAFLRRLRFVVTFPMPQVPERAAIWRRSIPAGVPTADVDVARLAQLDIAGGSIRTIVLNGAFMAAAAGEPMSMSHLMESARAEYMKLERPFPHVERSFGLREQST
jgi:hypothetical protein